jgi:hypothetical protein
MKLTFRFIITSLLLLLALNACGKYSKPLPPESFAPAAVKDLTVLPTVQGVAFNWVAPTTNSRSDELKDLEGYRIYRRELGQNARLKDPFAEFELIAEIVDTHLKELNELKAKAQAQGQISRRVTLPEERSRFQYLDNSVVSGKRYLYQIIPINQGGVEGIFSERIDVLFRGEISQVVRLPYTAEDFEL